MTDPARQNPESRSEPADEPAPSLVPHSGWHFLHLYYRVDRRAYAALDERARADGRTALAAALAGAEAAPRRLQAYAILGHKADFGVVAADPDPRVLHALQTSLGACPLGPALALGYSFTSLTEVSEYVPDADAYARILRDREGMDPESSIYKTRVQQYSSRLGAMNQHRLYPEFPDWPYVCFYPMNKMRREPGQNWYTVPFEERMIMMSEHGKSGMKFAGRVSQVITASTGLDDWEWGVTLWARNPSDIKDIVYTMRFDRASAQYAQFGPFYPGYILPAADLVAALRV
jgi:chlorite dismutase